MFFKQIRRNAARNRKGNGLFSGSLVIAITAFYTLLSLGKQDVILFLATVESDAVAKLMRMLPIVYAVSLFFVFFLVYFACRYQTDSRRRELGMYLMLGMKQSRLFGMLLGETLWSSLLSLLAGLPTALLLTEGISLATARIVGLGIIGHQFSFSPKAVLWTVCDFVHLKVKSSFPILILTARDTLADELTALGLGADDFLTKPCHPDRLLARAKRLLQTWHRMRAFLSVGPLALDTDAYKLTCRDRILLLTETEGKLLKLLMEHYPAAVEKEELFSSVWGTSKFIDENILPVNMSRLRKNLAEIGLADAIRNIRGKGYVLEVTGL